MPSTFGNLKASKLTLQGRGEIGTDISMSVADDEFQLKMGDELLMTVAHEDAAPLNSGTSTETTLTLSKATTFEEDVTIKGDLHAQDASMDNVTISGKLNGVNVSDILDDDPHSSQSLPETFNADQAYMLQVIRENTELAQRNYELGTQARMLQRHNATLSKITNGKKYDAIVVGSGPAGCALARCLAMNFRPTNGGASSVNTFWNLNSGADAWSIPKPKNVLLIERGSPRPVSFIGGTSYYNGPWNGFGEAAGAIEYQVFGRHFTPQGDMATQLHRLLPTIEGGYELKKALEGEQADANGYKLPYESDVEAGVVTASSILTDPFKAIDQGIDPCIFGGGSTHNGAAMQVAPYWFHEKQAAKAEVALDVDALQEAGLYMGQYFDRFGEGSLASRNEYMTNVGRAMGTAKGLGAGWIGDATGDDLENFMPVPGNSNVGYAIAERGGVRNRTNNLRRNRNGYTRRYAGAQLVEDYDNTFDNLDVLFYTNVHKINFDANKKATGITAEIGVHIPSLDTISGQVTVIPLTETGEVVTAGNPYGSSSLLERSGVGRADVLSAAGVNIVAENNYVGEHFINNQYFQRQPDIRIAFPENLGEEASKEVFPSAFDLRGPAGFGGNPNWDYNIQSHEPADRSTMRIEANMAIPKGATSSPFSTFQGAMTGQRHNGQIHISASSKMSPLVHNGWFENPTLGFDVAGINGSDGSQGDRKNGLRTLEGCYNAFMRYYDIISGRNAREADKIVNGKTYKVFPMAKYALGTGQDAEGNLVYQEERTKIVSLTFDAEGQGYIADEVTGVYVKKYEGYPLRSSTDPLAWEKNKSAFYAAWQSVKGNTSAAQDSIHWVGGCQLGKALGDGFKVKGVQGVRVACSAAFNVPFPYNNWAINAQYGHYVGLEMVGKVSKPSLNKVDGNPTAHTATLQGMIASGSSIVKNYGIITPVALVPGTNDFHYKFTKNGATTPTVLAKFVRLKSGKDGNPDTYCYRHIGDIEKGDIDMKDYYGSIAGALDVKMCESRLELTLDTTYNNHEFLFECDTYAYDANQNFVKAIGTFPIQPGYFSTAKGTYGLPYSWSATGSNSIQYSGKIAFDNDMSKAYLEVNDQVVLLDQATVKPESRSVTFARSTNFMLPIGSSWVVTGIYANYVPSCEVVFSPDGSTAQMNISFQSSMWAGASVSTTITRGSEPLSLIRPVARSGPLNSTPQNPVIQPSRFMADGASFCHIGPSGFPLVSLMRGDDTPYSIKAMPWFTREKLNADIMELWNGNITGMDIDDLVELKANADAHNVKISGMLSDRGGAIWRKEEMGDEYAGVQAQAGNTSQLNRDAFVHLITERIPVYKVLDLKYIRCNANTDLPFQDENGDLIQANIDQAVALVADTFKRCLVKFREDGYTGMLLLENHSVMTFKAEFMINVYNAVNDPQFALLADNNNWGADNGDGTMGPFKVDPTTEYKAIMPYTYVLCMKVIGNLGTGNGTDFVPKSVKIEKDISIFDWEDAMREWKSVINGRSQLPVVPLREILLEPEYTISNDVEERTLAYKNSIDYLRGVISKVQAE